VTVLLLVVVVIVTSMVQHVSMESVHPLAQKPTLGGGAKSGPIAGNRAFYTMFAPMLNNASEWPRAYNAYVYEPRCAFASHSVPPVIQLMSTSCDCPSCHTHAPHARHTHLLPTLEHGLILGHVVPCVT
jgi:hypothetical protein